MLCSVVALSQDIFTCGEEDIQLSVPIAESFSSSVESLLLEMNYINRNKSLKMLGFLIVILKLAFKTYSKIFEHEIII